MRAIIVDDELLMIRKFVRLSADIQDMNVVGQFDCADDAIMFASENTIEAAFIDVDMPIINGIELARSLKEIREDVIIVFISAYDEYIRDSNEIGGDYYIVIISLNPIPKKFWKWQWIKSVFWPKGSIKISIYKRLDALWYFIKMSLFILPARQRKSLPWSSQEEEERSVTRRSTVRSGRDALTATPA